MKRYILVWLLAICILSYSQPVKAENNHISLTISPLFFSYNLAGGQQQDLKLLVGNTSDQPLTIILESLDYQPSPDGVIPAALTAIDPNTSLKDWLRGPLEPITIAPQTMQPVLVGLEIPPQVAVGSHYGVIAARTVVSSSAAVNVSGRVGAIVLVNVGGPLDFSTRIKSIRSQGLSGPLQISTALQHMGNAHYRTSGEVAVKVWPWGKETTVKLPEQILVPGITRTLNVNVPQSPVLGLIVITTKLTTGDNKIVTATHWQWRSPFWLNISLGALILLLIINYWQKKHVR